MSKNVIAQNEIPRHSDAELALDKRAEAAGKATKDAVVNAFDFVTSNAGAGFTAVGDVVTGFWKGLRS